MARGWESKGIEEQQAEARASATSPAKVRQTPEQIARQHKKNALSLSRSRVVQQLEGAQNPTYRKILETALADLDRQLASQNEPEV